MIKIKHELKFQTFENIKNIVPISEITRYELVNLLKRKTDDDYDKLRLNKLSLNLSHKKLVDMNFPISDFKVQTSLVKENGLETIPEYITFLEAREKYKKNKSKLPLILASSYVNPKRSKEYVTLYRPTLILDIDHISLGNRTVSDIKEELSQLDWISMIFLSPGGDGLKIMVEYDAPEIEIELAQLEEAHKWIYNHFIELFKEKFNLELDTNNTDLSRTCILSRDPDLYFNANYKRYEIWQRYKHSTQITKTKSGKTKIIESTSNHSRLFEVAIDHFDKVKPDLFTDRNKWVALCFLVISAYGDKGLDVFQRLSQNASNYDAEACTKLYVNSLKSFKADRAPSPKWLMKMLIDNDYVVKPNDAVLKRYIWNESDYEQIKKELGFEIIQDDMTKDYYVLRNNKMTFMNDVIYNQIITDIRLNYSRSMNESVLRTYMFSLDNITIKNFIKESIDAIHESDSEEFDKMISFIDCYESKQLVSDIIKRWSLGVFKNIYESYYDEILVLKGGQGTGKTTFITKYFTSPFKEYLTTSFIWDANNKDSMKLLTNKMFIYDMENTSLTSKADMSNIKRITSTSTLDHRTPYAKYSDKLRRIASFIMDTNEDVVFNDLTGGRRFLILTVNFLNIYDVDGGELKKIDYNKVWGYIKRLWLEGKKPTDFDISALDNLRELSRLKSDLEQIIDEIFVVDNSSKMAFSQIKGTIKRYYSDNNLKYIDGEFSDHKIGRVLGKYKSKIERLGDKTQKLYFIRPRFQNELSGIADSKDDILNSLLDKLNTKEISLTEDVKELLKKLSN